MKHLFKLSAIAITAAFAFAPAAEAAHKSGHVQGHKAQIKVEPTRGLNSGYKVESIRGPASAEQSAGPKPCPPGLAKKGNGCLPPGQAKKLYGADAIRHAHGYRIGDPFDQRVPYSELRRNEYDRYGVPYHDGQYYVRTEDRLFRLDRKTNTVVDIITGIGTLLTN